MIKGSFNDEMKKYFDAETGAYTAVTSAEIEKRTFNVKVVIRNLLEQKLGKKNIPQAQSIGNQFIGFGICKKTKGKHQDKIEIQCKYSKPDSNEMSIYFLSSIIKEFNMKAGDIWYVYFKDNDSTPWLGILSKTKWSNLFDINDGEKNNIQNTVGMTKLNYNIDLENIILYEVSVTTPVLETDGSELNSTNPSTSAENTGVREMNKKIKGNIGEEIAVEIEKRRLKGIGRDDLIPKIVHISKYKDGLGYDIISTDVTENGDEEIYIEVKTTSGGITRPFQISDNEVKVSKKLGMYYYLYRIYNLKENSSEIYFYKKQGCICDNFKLKATSYRADPK